ncbi:MAG: acyl-ACP--UDP-N-acetylglucosamine O-acyltransferase [Magnetococcus sp. DMHC-6]
MIHPTAVIDPGAQLGQEVHIGPYSVIGAHVVLKDRVKIGAHSVVEGHTVIDEETQVYHFVSLGQAPQDLHYAGEPTRLEIGKRCLIREYASLHVGTVAGGGITRVGNDCMLMCYVHVAHDCQLGDRIIMANGATLAGHVEIGDMANIGGLTAVHQFVRIGRNAFIGGASAISMDVVPFAMAAGNRASITGVNVIGMRRSGFSEEVIKAVRKAHRLIFQSNLRLEPAIEEVNRQFSDVSQVQLVVKFLQSSTRGICR